MTLHKSIQLLTLYTLFYPLHSGVEKIVFSLPVPIRDESEIVNSLEKAIDLNPGIRIAILDHITSSTAIVMPIQRMIEVCRRRGILVFVDGAHAPGQVELNVETLGADYYTGIKDSVKVRNLLILGPIHKRNLFIIF